MYEPLFVDKAELTSDTARKETLESRFGCMNGKMNRGVGGCAKLVSKLDDLRCDGDENSDREATNKSASWDGELPSIRGCNQQTQTA